jgi:hypothetical protein
VWAAFALFALFAGTGTFASNALCGPGGRAERSQRFVFWFVIATAASGLILAVVLVAAGPWSRPFALMVALLAALLGFVALLRRPGGREP